MPRTSRLLAAGLALAAAPVLAQSARPRATAAHTWLQLTDEHRLAERWALFGDMQVRRADFPGRTPQQLEVRTGLLHDVGGGARIGVGYLWQHTAVYGELPIAAPTREHDVWEQIQFGSRTGRVAWAHRFRLEQRWAHPLTFDDRGSTARWQYRNRVRLMERATIDAPRLGIALPKAYVTAHEELFLHLGWTPEGQVFDQSRLGLQAGWRFGPRLRAEAGYLHQYLQRGAARATENNHTLLVGLVAASR
jgi:hypothetical protein